MTTSGRPESPAVMPDPSPRDQFHAAIYDHAPGTCQTCDTVRASGVFARNGRRPVVTSAYRPARRTRKGSRS